MARKRKVEYFSKGNKLMKKINQRELKIGTKIELEHTKSKRVAKKIATDHLLEFPKYYSKGLIPMEKKLRRRLK